MAAAPPPVPASAQALAQLILDRCTGGGLAPGARLPTERSLAAELGVSRTAVRNALGLLEATGRISREVGRGTFLRGELDGGRRAAASARDDVAPADVMSARQLIEPRVLPLVVARATARDLDELDRCIAGAEAADRYEEFEAWDLALHRAIVAAGHNALLVRMYAEIEDARKGALWGNLKRRHDSRERRAAYQQDHREIVDALRARELERALEATRRHLDRVASTLLEQAL